MSFDLDLIVQALPELLQSVLVTIELFVLLMLIATPISLLVALARVSSMLGLRCAAACYVNGIRCIPVLVILYFTFYGLPQLGLRIAPFTAALTGLTIGTVAYLAEDLRAGLTAIDPGQFQAADALGLGYWWRTRRIIVPQALPVMIGPYFTRAIVSLKATSMASIVAVNEVTGESMALLTQTYRALEFLTFAAITYLTLSAVLAFAQVILQRKVALP
ncbi:amino acid ABC transporter permease [Lichenifustis flavocetrariae]|uniref:Amino acid ABC transporter permease n=1 Tax=Lichenifustis flavocetrariae TaxID=2949735 RepID=A0AA41Z8A3_9HYPH|nr:amino acid ABC transporter permease [Lichenifustis flavocetrariae]MCW6512175.1 amino acid ABC transporter permease [Lichenifustis flavocetrariae]